MELSLPAALHTIGDAAFFSCPALRKLTLPATLTTIGESAFKVSK